MLRTVARLASVAALSLACTRGSGSEPPDQANTVAPIEAEQTDAPSPVQVCEHMLRVMTAEFGQLEGQPPHGEMMVACVNGVDAERARLGETEYVRQAGCIVLATTFAALEACDPEVDQSFDREVCQHIVDLAQIDTVESGVAPLTDDVAVGIVERCMQEMDKDRMQLGEQEVQRMGECVLAADSLPALEGCEPQE